MAAVSRGMVAIEGKVVANVKSSQGSRLSSSPRTASRRGGLAMPRSRSFKTLRSIQKSRSMKRSGSRVILTAMLGHDQAKKQDDDQLMFKFDDDDEKEEGGEEGGKSSDGAMVDTVNAVLADIVDGQKYLKETGRTKARPMKRRGVVVSLALGAFRGPINEVDGRLGILRRTPSTSRLARTPSCSGFGCTVQLFSQMSFGSGSSFH